MACLFFLAGFERAKKHKGRVLLPGRCTTMNTEQARVPVVEAQYK